MDPDAALQELRLMASDPNAFNFEQFVELFEGLDEWMSKGGFLPHDWAKGR